VSELTESCIIFKWRGKPGTFLMGVPARDLTGEDVLSVEDLTGLTEDDLLKTGLYEPVQWIEVSPFCGAKLEDGRCRVPVQVWGQRCDQHKEAVTWV